MLQTNPSPAAANPRRFCWRRLVQFRLRTLLMGTKDGAQELTLFKPAFVTCVAVALATVISFAVWQVNLACCHADDIGRKSTGKLVIEGKTITLSSAQATTIKNLVAKSKTKIHRERIPGIPWAFLTIDADHYFFPGNMGPMFETIKDGKEYRYYEDVTAEMIRGIVGDKK